MSKKILKLVGSKAKVVKPENTSVDWKKCIICQMETGERLRCPGNSKCVDSSKAYETVAQNLITLENLNSLPFDINFALIDEGRGIEQSFTKYKASWHKSCYLKCNTNECKRAQKRKLEENTTGEFNISPVKYTRQRSGSFIPLSKSAETCFFCEKPRTEKGYSLASTTDIDKNVRRCVHVLQDKKLMCKLSSGDMIALEASYHTKCLIELYNRERDFIKEQENLKSNNVIEGVVLAELVSYINEIHECENVVPVFKLADLTKLYESRLNQLGIILNTRVHSTRLKNRLIDNIPGLKAQIQGRETLLIFDQDIGPAVKQACNNYDNDGLILAKAAEIVRKDMMKVKNHFCGTFDKQCQQEAVPRSLVSLVSMILHGSNIKSQAQNCAIPQPTLSISQLLQYNLSCNKGYNSGSYHNKEYETPLVVYIGLEMHTKFRKRDIIDQMFNLGLSISYDRVLNISTQIGAQVIEEFEKSQVICPPNLRKALFTTAAIDNIDHNQSSTSAKTSFHGTSLSLFQHPSKEFCGFERGINLEATAFNTHSKVVPELPEYYTCVPPVVIHNKEPDLPDPVVPPSKLLDNFDVYLHHFEDEKRWSGLPSCTDNSEPREDEYVTWTAFHAKSIENKEINKSIISLLPLFFDLSKSYAMIKHGMDIVKNSTKFLNPLQIPVITMDQPLFAIAKTIQWTWPDTHGEKEFVIFFAGLHLEMAAFTTVGDLLKDSGWATALVQANITTSGKADAFHKASHITRTRYAHQVTAKCLVKLMKDAYHQACELEVDLEFDPWLRSKVETSPTVKYWALVLHLELVSLLLVRSIREGNFQLYIETLTELCPWFFSLNHTNYSRWVSVHLSDMIQLERTNPYVFEEFQNGNFVIHKTEKVFSGMAIDQGHEQNNAIVKGDGGAIGILDNDNALRRWMVAGPEVSRITEEFKDIICQQAESKSNIQYESSTQQAAFERDIKSLFTSFKDFGNPFLEDSSELIVLDSRIIADAKVVETIYQIEELGNHQFQDFVRDRLENKVTSFYSPIKRNKLQLLSTPAKKKPKASQMKLSSLKGNCSLFSRLYISCQTREGDLDNFFSHENTGYPPALSDHGNLHLCQKADLLKCLECSVVFERPDVDMLIFDGSAIVNMLKPNKIITFGQYFMQIFKPFILKHFAFVDRIDVVWDIYKDDSLKAFTRSKRGSGIRIRVELQTKVPKNWQDFLRSSENKTEFFHFLAQLLIKQEIPPNKQLVVTHNADIFTNPPFSDATLSPCNHEEADTRMLLHVYQAVENGTKKILLKTVDTDVLVLSVYAVRQLHFNLWLEFGTGDKLRYIPAHEIAKSLGIQKSQALPLFHAFTGCDTVSGFVGKGKKSGWETWKVYDEVTQCLIELSNMPLLPEINDECIRKIERFVILLYDRSSNCTDLNRARKYMFAKKGKSIEGIPPTKAALFEHLKRAVYQSGYCWSQLFVPIQQLPNPTEWGWLKETDSWEPLWSSLPEASVSCQELLKCGCTKGCRGRCKCVKAELPCTALCMCGGDCSRT